MRFKVITSDINCNDDGNGARQQPIAEKMAELQDPYDGNSSHQYGNMEAAAIGLEFPLKCYYCDINCFATKDEYEKNGIMCHERLPLYPGPADIKKHKILSQGMPWEREIKRDLFFQFELGPNEETKNG